MSWPAFTPCSPNPTPGVLRDRGAVQGLERVTLDELVAETLPEARCQCSGLDLIGSCCCRGLVLTSRSIDAILFVPMHTHAHKPWYPTR